MKFNSEAYDKAFPRKEEKPKTESSVEKFEDDDEVEEVDNSTESEEEEIWEDA